METLQKFLTNHLVICDIDHVFLSQNLVIYKIAYKNTIRIKVILYISSFVGKITSFIEPDF